VGATSCWGEAWSVGELKVDYRDMAKVWPDRFGHDERLQKEAQEKL